MKLVGFLLQTSWQTIAIASLCGFLSGGSSAALVALMSYALSQSSPSFTIASSFIALAVLATATSILTRILVIRLSQNAVFHLQIGLSQRILASELRHLETLGSPRLLASLTEDIQTISQAVYVLPFLCINIAIVTGCFLYIIWLSWQVLLAVLFLAFIAAMSCRFLLKLGKQALIQAREEQDRLFGHFRALTEGIKELKLHSTSRQDFFKQDLEPTAARVRDRNGEGLTFFATTDSWGKSIFFFAIGLVLFVLPRFMSLNLQTLSAYVLTFTYLIGPLENIVSKIPLLGKASVALDKIELLQLSMGEEGDRSPLTPLNKGGTEEKIVQQPTTNNQQPTTNNQQPTTNNQIQLKGVTYTYRRESEDIPFTLGPVNLAIAKGELIFIVGGNGSGKSTLAKILTGLYSPEMGEIYLNGVPINSENREWYRQHFSVIFSDFYLFPRVLGVENLAAKEEEVREYLHLLQLHRHVKIKKGTFSTTALSQGQRKRLALLAAYLEDRPIYLFDEWAADQDPLFKDIFYRQLLPDLQAKGKTILAIAHDDRYFSCGDRLLKLESGKILGSTELVM